MDDIQQKNSREFIDGFLFPEADQVPGARQDKPIEKRAAGKTMQ